MARRPLSNDVRAGGGRAREGRGGRRAAETEEKAEEEAEEELSGAACLPRCFFVLLMGLLGLGAAVEVRNRLRHPSLLRASAGPGGSALVFYQKGHAAAREAWLFDEPQGSAGPPRLLQRIDCRAPLSELGELRWTADGRAIYAAGQSAAGRGVPVLRWMVEFAEAGSGPAALVVSRADWALAGRAFLLEGPAAMGARWRRHGGAGAVVLSWYEVGKQGPHLFSWQTTRWEQALPN